jgi:hypothetical protein
LQPSRKPPRYWQKAELILKQVRPINRDKRNMKIATEGKNIARSARRAAQPESKTKQSNDDRKASAVQRTAQPEQGIREEPFIETDSNKSTGRSASQQWQPVHFELTNPSARKVCIAGSFNDWKPETTEMVPLGTGKWTKDLTLPPGTYEYRLVVDGKWMPDPTASRTVPNPFGEPNSVLTVPAQAAATRSAKRAAV